MTKSTYVAIAPDGSEHTRKTDRTYTHAVLLEGEEGWGAVGFCGRPDLAEKKRREHPGSIMVECGVLGDRAADMLEADVTENAEPTAPEANDKPEREQTVDEKIAAATVHDPAPKRTVGSLVQELLMDPDLGYLAIVDRVMAEFPDAKTSVRSVASVAAGLRRKGVNVPMRRTAKAH
ncbi:MAG: hypothetical protein WBA02_09885 [Jannaschia helgolandensis]|uniref:Uncharacterized protein n=1 Tax=Jannaschia helgolandensis TaxID=188906 RepID=A0A1H7P4H0_9RHOB|nr:hypothetical protein [Jannaschia helgolandensis]SEL30228.1 hypothetical protein SAMN04488526_2401 [Jannaschia helgolandensis]